MTSVDFEKGYERGREKGEARSFDAMYLPDSIKEDLCRSLLAEFGVTSVSVREPDGELIVKCVMPWHPEKKASAALNYRRLVYKCLGCGASGGLLWLIGTVRHASGDEARAWVETQTGLGNSDFDLNALLSLFDAIYADPRSSAPPPMPTFSMRALEPWRAIHPWLTDPVEDGGRAIPIDNLIEANVGYESKYPMGKDEEGNLRPTSERIIIPHFWRGKLVGWQSRRLSDDGSPKYKSTPDFPKDRTIYQYDAKRRTAVVVESPSSVLRHSHHQPIEATFGANVTDRQIRLLANHERVIFWFDNDPAGWKAVWGWEDEKRVWHPGLGERLEPYCEVWVVESPWAADPADMDDETVDDLVANAVPFSMWNIPKHLTCWTCKTEHDGECEA